MRSNSSLDTKHRDSPGSQPAADNSDDTGITRGQLQTLRAKPYPHRGACLHAAVDDADTEQGARDHRRVLAVQVLVDLRQPALHVPQRDQAQARRRARLPMILGECINVVFNACDLAAECCSTFFEVLGKSHRLFRSMHLQEY